jgi:hypothetical protein
MLLHIDASQHRWLCDERWYDLLVILDDATSEIYFAGDHGPLYGRLVRQTPINIAGQIVEQSLQ